MIVCSLPVPLSRAVTLRMPLASMLKATSICGVAHPGGRDALEVELAEQAVVGGHRPLALVDLDRHGRLVVLGGGEGLLLLGRDRGVPLDQLGEDAPLGLQAERQRGDVEQEQVLDVAGQDRPLDGRADGDDLVGVDPLVRLLAEDLLDDLLDPRHPGRAADQHDLVDLATA